LSESFPANGHGDSANIDDVDEFRQLVEVIRRVRSASTEPTSVLGPMLQPSRAVVGDSRLPTRCWTVYDVAFFPPCASLRSFHRLLQLHGAVIAVSRKSVD
jgi:hypothetical protein